MDNKKDLKELNKWKKYNIKVTFREIKPKNGKPNYQMLLYFDNDLVYTTRKNAFKLEKYKERKLKSIKKRLFDWKDFDDWYEDEYEILKWEQKDYEKFSNWCRNFKMCTKILQTVQEEKQKTFKRKLNL